MPNEELKSRWKRQEGCGWGCTKAGLSEVDCSLPIEDGINQIAKGLRG